jgi:essential nuclear protein 1
MPRAQKPSKPRHDPLHVQLDEDEVNTKYGRISQPGKRKKSKKADQGEDENGEARLNNPSRGTL